jgi:hypothetical protein
VIDRSSAQRASCELCVPEGRRGCQGGDARTVSVGITSLNGPEAARRRTGRVIALPI